MRLVVIGGVAAGLSAAARARRLDKRLDIVVLEKGPIISYAACGLPYYVGGEVASLEQLSVYTAERFQRERDISICTGTEVVAISHPRREVVLSSGERLRYDRLVIATGARPDTAGIAGARLDHVFTLHTLEDASRLQQFLRARNPKRAAVVGAGYIGLEAAEALRTRGLEVTLFQSDGSLLGHTDALLVKAISDQLQRFGVDYVPNRSVRSIDPCQVDGKAFDLVVLASGLRPNAEIAADTGIELGRSGAIRVDERMETSTSGVFAAGDCAEAVHLVTGRPTYIPLGTTANKMGRVAGANAAGARERFPGIVGTSIVRFCGLGVATTGLSLSQARAEGFDAVAASISDSDRPSYFHPRPTQVELVAHRSTGRLLGGLVVGEEGVQGRINTIATALHARMTVEDFAQVDLAYAPPFAPVWDPLLIAAQQLLKLL